MKISRLINILLFGFLVFIFSSSTIPESENSINNPQDFPNNHLVDSLCNRFIIQKGLVDVNDYQVITKYADTLISKYKMENQSMFYKVIFTANVLLANQGEFVPAIRYSELLYAYAKARDDDFGYAISDLSLGMIYRYFSKDKLATIFFQKSWDNFRYMDGVDMYNIFAIYYLIAQKEKNRNTLDKSEEKKIKVLHNVYLELSKDYLSLFIKDDIYFKQVAFVYGTGEYYSGEYKASIDYFNQYFEGEKIIDRNDYYQGKVLLSNAYYALGEKEKAFKLDSIVYAEKNDLFLNLYADNDIYTLQSQLLNDKKAGAKLAQQSKNLRNLLILSIILIFITIVVFIILSLKYHKYKKMSKDLEKIRYESSQVINDKIKVLSDMGHEIRTPLNAINGFTEMLIEYEDDPEMMLQCKELIENSVSDLTELISETSNGSDYKYTDVNLCSFIKRMIITVKTAYPGVNTFDYKINSSISEDKVINMPVLKIEQVITNLMTNANKFTKNGKITLALTLKDKDNIEISVTDTGVGVAKDIKDDVFTRYTNEDNTGVGTGLGLSICKEIIELLGGNICLDKDYKNGACFRFVFPIVSKPIYEKAVKKGGN